MDDKVGSGSDEAVYYLASIRRILFGMMLISLLTAAYFARDLILPLVLGVLIALVLSPLTRTLRRGGVPAWLASTLIGVTTFVILTAGVLALKNPVLDLAADAPTIAMQVKTKLRDVIGMISDFREMGENIADMASGEGAATGPTPLVNERIDILAMVTSQAIKVVSTFGGSLLLAMFILGSDDLIQRRLVEIMPRLSDKKKALGIARDVERQISRYLGAITLINIGLGVAVGISMWVIGLPMAGVWGVAAWLLNYLPFVGPFLGMAAVGMVGLVTFDNLGTAILPPLAYFILNAIEANIVTPTFVGRRLELNTIAVFIMVMVWIWLWGVWGAFLAVPFLVVVRVLCDSIEDWQKFGRFLAADSD